MLHSAVSGACSSEGVLLFAGDTLQRPECATGEQAEGWRGCAAARVRAGGPPLPQQPTFSANHGAGLTVGSARVFTAQVKKGEIQVPWTTCKL